MGFDDGGECTKICMLIMANDHIGMITDEGTSFKMLKKKEEYSALRVAEVNEIRNHENTEFRIVESPTPLRI